MKNVFYYDHGVDRAQLQEVEEIPLLVFLGFSQLGLEVKLPAEGGRWGVDRGERNYEIEVRGVCVWRIDLDAQGSV